MGPYRSFLSHLISSIWDRPSIAFFGGAKFHLKHKHSFTKICFKTYLITQLPPKKTRKKYPKAITVLKKEGGGTKGCHSMITKNANFVTNALSQRWSFNC